MIKTEETYFRQRFRRAAEACPHKDIPLVDGGKSFLQYAEALDDPASPDGRLLMKMADSLENNRRAIGHGYRQVIDLFSWMAEKPGDPAPLPALAPLFAKAVRETDNNACPLVGGGLSLMDYANALADPANPNGRLLTKMARAVGEKVRDHGAHTVIRLFTGMVPGSTT